MKLDRKTIVKRLLIAGSIVGCVVLAFAAWCNVAFVSLSCDDPCTLVEPKPDHKGETWWTSTMFPGPLRVVIVKNGVRYEYVVPITRGENYFNFNPPAPWTKATET